LPDMVHQFLVTDRRAVARRRIGHLAQQDPVPVVDLRRLELQGLETDPVTAKSAVSADQPK
jgi:hypothetical protein